MSIVTLKRKTQAKYNNMSVGSKTGFSLNGTHRSQGYVGQTSLSRSLPRTLMKGNVICGYGGCCGKFPIMPIVQSAVISQNNPNVVKSSVMNTAGMIDTKYKWVNRPQPYSSTKPDNNNNINNQGDYIDILKRHTIYNINNCNINKNITKSICYNDCNNMKNVSSITKSQSDFVPISYGEYIIQLNKKCTQNEIFYTQNKKMNKTPFACGL